MNRKISFQIDTIDGHKMAVDLFLPEIQSVEKLDVLVYCHGFKGFKDWGWVPHIHDFLVTDKQALLTFNHSLNGVKHRDFDDLESFANNTVGQELRDLESLALWIAEEGKETYGFNPEKINWLGHSRGGANVIVFSQLFPEFVNKIITWSAIDSYESLFSSIDKQHWEEHGSVSLENKRTKQMMPLNSVIWKDIVDNKNKYNIQNAARQMSKPWMLAHGVHDEVVPFQVAENFYKSCGHSILFPLENSDHTFGCKHPMKGLEESTSDFWTLLDNTLSFIEEEEV